MPGHEYEYERLPASGDEKRREYPRHEPTSDVRELHRRLAQDPRFNPPPPSPWKRLALIVFFFFLCYVGLKLRLNAIQQLEANPGVVHANRYSNEFKFRPAASPIITEKLKDGRTRLRGAAPTARQ